MATFFDFGLPDCNLPNVSRKAMLTKAAIKKAAEDACKNICEFDCNDLDQNLNTIVVVCIVIKCTLVLITM